MTEVTARAALAYATDEELLKLYGVIVAGALAPSLLGAVAISSPNPLIAIVGLVLSIASLVAVVAGVVGTVYKVLSDVRAA